jgi:hypothetical protein
LLYKLLLGEIVTTAMTVAYNREEFQYRDVIFTVWDVGARPTGCGF